MSPCRERQQGSPTRIQAEHSHLLDRNLVESALSRSLDFASLDELDPSLGETTSLPCNILTPAWGPFVTFAYHLTARSLSLHHDASPVKASCMICNNLPCSDPAAENFKLFAEREVPLELRTESGTLANDAGSVEAIRVRVLVRGSQHDLEAVRVWSTTHAASTNYCSTQCLASLLLHFSALDNHPVLASYMLPHFFTCLHNPLLTTLLQDTHHWPMLLHHCRAWQKLRLIRTRFDTSHTASVTYSRHHVVIDTLIKRVDMLSHQKFAVHTCRSSSPVKAISFSTTLTP